MSVERAVHRLTGEIGQWMGMDTGVLVSGHEAVWDGAVTPSLGQEHGFGWVLRAT